MSLEGKEEPMLREIFASHDHPQRLDSGMRLGLVTTLASVGIMKAPSKFGRRHGWPRDSTWVRTTQTHFAGHPTEASSNQDLHGSTRRRRRVGAFCRRSAQEGYPDLG